MLKASIRNKLKSKRVSAHMQAMMGAGAAKKVTPKLKRRMHVRTRGKGMYGRGK